MRDFKFRVWNGAEMVYDVTTGRFGTFYVNPEAKGDGLDPKDTASLTPFTTIYHDPKVMQFAEVLDTKEKEIYEGDIVKHKERPEFSGLVRFSKGSMFVVAKTKTDERQEIWNGVFLEKHAVIIGNCYENPELMDWFKKPGLTEAVEGEIVKRKKGKKK